MRVRIAGVVFGLFLGFAVPAHGGSHLWVINELFSNADGTVQFIEMKECCGAPGETGLTGRWVRSEATSNQFDFPGDLVGPTSDRHLLLATAAFAALPGAPTPDYIIIENFFSLEEDSITYWFYTGAELSFLADDLPLDGINSFNRDGSTAPNTPTNYAGESGTVDASGGGTPTEFIRADANQDGGVEIADAISILDALFGGVMLGCDNAADTNDDEANDIADAVFLLSYLFVGGPAPDEPFPACGEDPTPGALDCTLFAACP